jgi:hypothetical protein
VQNGYNYYVVNTFSASELLAHVGTTDRFAITADSWYSYFSVETTSKFIKRDTQSLYISKIIGIKYSSSGGSGGGKSGTIIDYSITEQDTGKKWIDGKPIYQKVVLLYSNGSLVSGLTISNYIISGNTIPTNIDTLIDYHGISERGTDVDEGYVDNYAGMGSSLSYVMVPNIFKNTIYFRPYSAVKDVFIIYEYTKTTDTAE